MSIINDAIKKARKEFEIKNKPAVVCAPPKETIPANKQQASSEIKWTIAVVVSLVTVISLLGSIALYRYMSKVDTAGTPAAEDLKLKTFSPAFNLPGQKQNLRGANMRNAVELNGIVYGPEDKWAIINNKIVREGDNVMGGEIVSIAKDSVRIEKDNGEEIVLDLK